MNLTNRIARLEAAMPDPRDLPIQVVEQIPSKDGTMEAATVVITGTELGTISRENTETESAFLRRVCALKAGGGTYSDMTHVDAGARRPGFDRRRTGPALRGQWDVR
ncbi:hypothetical protein R3X27_16465 [Tropicimonas sp. TH_r6]|uniref:hypothetical protein n=1 Tax=Tropicimonas sp. TH_r6 TaxID=3082085 RepID=UPI00295394D4|nr:hypothetical protein [Tropicimonas sp. TH_r6]MDV7144280.1 hypothetical protein [Tropicimonas sp. TH_r6]